MAEDRQGDGTTGKLTERDAELAFWFHIDPRTMGRGEKLGYLANLERCKAQQTIHLGNYDPLNYQQVYSLWLLAYGDEEQARAARLKAQERLVDRQCGAARGR